MRQAIVGIAVILSLSALSWAQADATGQVRLAQFILSNSRNTRGLALDLGCGDASLALALAERTNLRIQCVDSDPAVIRRARRSIDGNSVYGTRVSANVGSLRELAYPSYCASLIICGDEFVGGRRERDFGEIFRILNPNGVAIIGQSAAAATRASRRLTRRELTGWLKEAGVGSFQILENGGMWARITRPRSPDWDEWTHRSHDPANTYASNDRLAMKDLKLLWASAPLPGLASASVLVAGGWLVEIGQGHAAHPETTPYIQVSDAFTGIRLWAKVGRAQLGIDRPLLNYSPIRACSDVVAVDGRLYVLGSKLCHVLDLETGEEKARFGIPAQANPAPGDIWLHLACVGDALYGSVGPSPRHQLRGFYGWGGTHWREMSKAVFALDRASGRLRWARRLSVGTASIAIADDRLLCVDADKAVLCLDLKTGQTLFRKATAIPRQARITQAAAYRGKLWLMYSPNGNTLSRARDKGWTVAVFSTKDGRLLHEPQLAEAVSSMTLSAGTVFMCPQHAKGQIYALDAETATVSGELLPSPTGSKCTPILATPGWLLYRHQAGSGFVRINRQSRQRYTYHRIRCGCHYPGLPANGLLYVQGAGCNCAHPFRAHVALIPGRRARAASAEAGARLVKGKAYGTALGPIDKGAWATWRADCARSGKTDQSPPGAMKQAWTRKLPGAPTPAAAGGGSVFCGSTDHKLYALDAITGKSRWEYISNGRIRVAPHLWRGRIFFGDDDGWVYCLRAEDGELVWKFRAALGDERIVAYGDFTSAWPIGNGVLVHDGKAYFSAGFFPGDGGTLYAVDAATGEVLWTKSRRGRRASIECTFGPMAMGDSVLFLPTVGGAPLGVHVNDPDHRPYFNLNWMGAFSPRGHLVMTLGDRVVVGSPHLQYIHHVTTYYDVRKALPVVTDEAIYLRDGHLLTAEKRRAYKVHNKRGEFTYVQSRLQKRIERSPDPSDLLWNAWQGVTMTCAIKAGDNVFTGSEAKVHATRAADGKELWSAPMPDKATDLAFHGERLFVVTEGGFVVCFAPKQ